MVENKPKQGQQSLRVKPDVWRRARVKALGNGESMTAVVQRLLLSWLGEADGVPPEPRKVAVPASAVAAEGSRVAPVARPVPRPDAIDDRCANCDERRVFHNGGGTGTIGRKNCRAFVERDKDG